MRNVPDTEDKNQDLDEFIRGQLNLSLTGTTESYVGYLDKCEEIFKYLYRCSFEVRRLHCN